MATNRDRVLDASIELFNHSGTIAITTNHIAKHLKISPGNLYFHFRNRESIVRELFKIMCAETYASWDPAKGLSPLEFIDASFEVLWRFRFFHREMYHLRRIDPELSRQWKKHLKRCLRLLKMNYFQWIKAGFVRPIEDANEMQQVTDAVLLFSSASLCFFESPEKPASRKPMKVGSDYLTRLLWPYMTAAYRSKITLA